MFRKKMLVALNLLVLLIVLVNLTPPNARATIWQPWVRLTNDAGFDRSPSVTQTSDGKIWVVWTGDREAYGGYSRILYMTYDPVSNWTAEKVVAATFDNCTDSSPSIMQAKNGTIFIAWESNRLNTSIYAHSAIFYSVSNNNGASWSNAKALTDNQEENQEPRLFQAANGTIWLVWTKYHGAPPLDNYDIFYKTYDGAKWSPEHQLTTDPLWDVSPSITQTLDGKIWVVWSKIYANNTSDIYYQTYSNNQWSDVIQLIHGVYTNTNAAICQMIWGTIWVVYTRTDTENGFSDLWYITSNGTVWNSPTPLTSANSDRSDSWPGLFQAKDRGIWLVWASDRFDFVPPDYANWELAYQTSKVFPGDVNGDDQVYTYDLAAIGVSYGQQRGSSLYNPAADLNNDGQVWAEDLAIVGKNFGLGTSPPP